MVDFYILFFLYVAVAVFEVVPLIRKKNKKVLTVYIPIFVFTFIITILHALGTDIPSPIMPIQTLISSIFKIE